MIFSATEIEQTVNMFMRQKLDIRAITMGISLRDCISDDGKKCRNRIYDKIMKRAGNLVKVGREIEAEFGVPIINKRIAVTPIAMIAEASGERNYVAWAETLDKAAKELGVDFAGGFRAKRHHCGRRRSYRFDSRGSCMHRTGMLVGQSRFDEERHQYGRRKTHGTNRQKNGGTHERKRRHRLRKARRVLQRAGRQSIYGGRISRTGRRGRGAERRRFGTGRHSRGCKRI